MMKTYSIKPGQKPSEDLLKDLEVAKALPHIPDDDCPDLTPEMKVAFHAAAIQRNSIKASNNVSNL